MHEQAYAWVAQHATGEKVAVLDIGGRNINGTVVDLFPAADPYVTLDVRDGAGVDIVADAADWEPDRQYDIVVCCEVFEHTSMWPEIIATAYKALVPGGLFIATMAGPGRPEHSAVDGLWRLHEFEHYANIEPGELSAALKAAGFEHVMTDQRRRPADVRCTARRPLTV